MARFLLIHSDVAILKQMEEALNIQPADKKAATASPAATSAPSASPSASGTPSPTPAGAKPAAGEKPSEPATFAKFAHETEHEIIFEHDEKKIEELVNKEPFDTIFMEQAFVKGAPHGFAGLYRKKITLHQNQSVKFVILSFDENVDTVRKYMMRGGYEDYIVLPIDAPIFREKISLMVSKKNAYKKEIYSMQVNEPVRVAFNFEIEDIGEFGLTLRSNKKYEPNEIISFFATPFRRNATEEIIGKCYYSDKHPSQADMFQSKFVFVGNGSEFKKTVRVWLKTEYVRKKAQAA